MAELIVHNAHIFPMVGKSIRTGFLVVRDGRILTMKSGNDWREFKGRNTLVLNCRKRALIPGFIDSHFHLRASAESMVVVDLAKDKSVRSINDIQDRIEKYSQDVPRGNWIRANGYHEFYLAEKRHPFRWDLDRASSIHPIKLTHRTGHAHVLNSLALKLAGITRSTPEPPGGLIDRDLETGEPTGLLYEMGGYLSKTIPPLAEGELSRGIEKVNTQLLSCGITSIHEATRGNDMGQLDWISRLKREKILIPKITMMQGFECFIEHKEVPFEVANMNDLVRLGGVKIILDESTGRLYPHQEELNEMVSEIHKKGFQAVIHAIEESTVEPALNAIEHALRKCPKHDHRHRIEHCALCSPPLLRRLASLGVMIVTQPSFIFYNGDRYLETIPARKLRHLYPIGSLFKAGIAVAGSSDCPVAPPNPLIGIYSAVSRKCQTGKSIARSEKIELLEALRMYTIHAARAVFEEKIKGTVTPGKMADLVVLSDDPTRMPVDELKDLEVEVTILNGKVVWSRKA